MYLDVFVSEYLTVVTIQLGYNNDNNNNNNNPASVSLAANIDQVTSGQVWSCLPHTPYFITPIIIIIE